MQFPKSNRAVLLAQHIATTKSTVRETADVFGISKSTVHKDVTSVLPLIDRELYLKVEAVLQLNKAERHIRGGEATKQKFLAMHK